MSESVIRCDVISAGVAEGSLCLFETLYLPTAGVEKHSGQKPEAEMNVFKEQLTSLVRDLGEAVDSLESEALSAEADVIRAHISMLQDPMFHARVQEAIGRLRFTAESAVEHVIEGVTRVLAESRDARLAERATDLKDLALQLRGKLARQQARSLPELLREIPDPVLAIPELLPSIVLHARRYGVKAFLMERGTALSHGAILAKAFALPALRVPTLEMLRISHGANVLVDADAGELLIEPDRGERKCRLQPVIEVSSPHAVHHLPVRLWVNIVTPTQLEGFDWRDIEGVGLYRTETRFMERTDDFPREEEEVGHYRHLFALCGDRPVTVRTVDLGADKTVPYMCFGPQDNPYLGLRGHRIYHFHPDLLITQLRAILRAAAGPHRLRLLYPMLETVDQWRLIQGLVEQAVASLRAENLPFQQQFEQGVLIETPAAVLSFQRLLGLIDFASVGTNDLVQYLFAVERNNANVAKLYQPEHPIVLQVLKNLADQAREAGKSLSVCGEIASDPELLMLLVGLGIDNLSVAPKEVSVLKARLTSLRIPACRELAHACLEAQTAAEVRAKLGIRPQSAIEATSTLVGRGQAVDPVCKMIVKIEENPYSLVDRDRRYYFCSRPCTLQFQRETDREGSP
ncbi:MAG: phosphoenolpyruvate--protein phosphotransferase [Proteobacteria bacterium]|nr:phosphoenolpyruvate--protein phosphotransferase [Pseudomonadota bacterium]NIS67569.1 phosphoenolpyruvate--protein phosphotransferase [Pseudomonadota bacterium]